jgi:acetylornithine deacetylase
MLEKLISFPTVSRDSNMDLINFVRAYLGEYGIESRLVPNEDGSKANLYASVGPAVPGGVVLSGHTDVVPVDGQEWTTDPFRLVERDGLLVGRGTADMKGFIAIGLALVPDMLAAGIKKPIHFALSYDEEVGCIGAPYMIEHMVANLPRPRAVIVGEPTSMKVVTEHKGSISFHTHVSGHSVHSAYVDRGVSAVVTGARLVTFLDDMMQENIARVDPQNPFDPPFTTVHTGVIEGGTAPNIVAKDCRFTTDIRSISDDDPEAYFHRFQAHIKDTVEPTMRQVVPETGIDLTNYRYVPGLKRESDGEAERLSRQITGDNSTNVVSYGTEAGHFQSADYSVVVCGPGSIDQAHKPDEFVSVDQYNAGVNFVERLIKQLT